MRGEAVRRRQPNRAEAERIRDGIMRGRCLFMELERIGWAHDGPAWKQREVEEARSRVYRLYLPYGLHYQVRDTVRRTYEALIAEKRRGRTVTVRLTKRT